MISPASRALLCGALALLWIAAPAPSAQASFGLHDLDVTATAAQDGTVESRGGSHPFTLDTEFSVNTVFDSTLEALVPDEDFRDVRIDFPPGLVADRDAVSQCTTVEFRPPGGGAPQCSKASAVGIAEVELPNPGSFETSLLYNLTPPPGAVAKLGFEVSQVPVTIELALSQTPPYHGVARLSNALQVYGIYSSRVSVWGVPGDAAHGGSTGSERPFLTMPRSCTGPLETTLRSTSWQGGVFETTLESHDNGGAPLGMTECATLNFSPTISARPTATAPTSPSGLDFGLAVADPGLANSAGRAASDIRKAVVTLPRGMTVNPSQAEGLAVCSEADLTRESVGSEFGAGCPAPRRSARSKSRRRCSKARSCGAPCSSPSRTRTPSTR